MLRQRLINAHLENQLFYLQILEDFTRIFTTENIIAIFEANTSTYTINFKYQQPQTIGEI